MSKRKALQITIKKWPDQLAMVPWIMMLAPHEAQCMAVAWGHRRQCKHKAKVIYQYEDGTQGAYCAIHTSERLYYQEAERFHIWEKSADVRTIE